MHRLEGTQNTVSRVLVLRVILMRALNIRIMTQNWVGKTMPKGFQIQMKILVGIGPKATLVMPCQALDSVVAIFSDLTKGQT